jgi:hypothetical protein
MSAAPHDLDVKLTVRVEFNDHDGYCSGSECEYTCDVKTVTVRVPNTDSPTGVDWAPYIACLDPADDPPRAEPVSQSCCCELGVVGTNHGLNVHQSRLTVIGVERLN